ncbi:hypothetical protein Pmani_002445 [Petrolisthes manimaculis]|uniref:Uncharacterized protein n=1 Tax=Petrolisthes manimaculis TaxID=1843537 RepID=A0AAE1QII7_9EUCA|nr:hypothetical protein Pmani_002445 [Petrolisthes manimaculis]
MQCSLRKGQPKTRARNEPSFCGELVQHQTPIPRAISAVHTGEHFTRDPLTDWLAGWLREVDGIVEGD